MKHIISISLFLLLIMSCSSDDNVIDDSNLICSVENPIENLTWLKSEIDLLKNDGEKYNYVIQTKHNDQTVFVFRNCNPFSNSVILVRNCEGENIGSIGTRQEDISSSILENGTIIWKSDKFECDL